MSIPRIIYLTLTIAGGVMTWYYNLQFMEESGGTFNVFDFVAATTTNAASKSISWDLVIACFAGVTFIYLESRRLGLRYFWAYIVFAFGIAFAFALPLFLFVRQGKIEAIDTQAS
jgi:hypothetical protein